jgi:hypothetical protein
MARAMSCSTSRSTKLWWTRVSRVGVGVAWRGLKTIAWVPEGGGVKTLRDDGGARMIIWRRELLGLAIYMYWTPTWHLYVVGRRTEESWTHQDFQNPPLRDG